MAKSCYFTNKLPEAVAIDIYWCGINGMKKERDIVQPNESLYAHGKPHDIKLIGRVSELTLKKL